jgi:1,2-diacylglycerol 3-beta-galactosyltransferase
MRKLDFIYFDAGGGHRAAATALKLAIERQARPWQVRLVHLKEILAPADVFKKVLRIDLEEIYNLLLRRGWTLGMEPGMRFMQAVIRLYHGTEVRLLERWWRGPGASDPPDLVVSLVPNFNRAIHDALGRALPGVPCVTVLTDLADFPPRFWLEPQRQYVICGTETARRQALEMGHAPDRVMLTSGMILHPRFYDQPEIGREAGRRDLGLDPARPTGIVLFGGYGSNAMRRIFRRLEHGGGEAQFIWIAGRNEALRRWLESQPSSRPRHVVGFTSEVPRYMRLADFLIGKPGPASISEAIRMGLPVITVRNAWTIPQERFNTGWLEENGLGIVLPRYGRVDEGVRRMLSGDTLARQRANAARVANNAVFEIPDLLEDIMNRGEP